MKEKLFYYKYPIGEVGIIEDDGCITGVFFQSRKDKPKNRDKIAVGETALIKKTAGQLEEYFDRKRDTFDIPLSFKGTDFQIKVWEALLKIPFGETRSYKEIAAMAGNEKACRAAGMANNRNPIAIIVPCHRVIGANGSLVGYGGGLDIKKYLLKLETAGI